MPRLSVTLAALGILSGSLSLAAEPSAECLLQPGAEGAEARMCLQCHDGSRAKSHLQTSHPVDLEYAEAQRKNAAELRPEAEVVARGGFLPGGMLRCTTCHSPRSPWAARINLPPNAKVRPAVNPFRPATYEQTGAATGDEPAPGSEVSPKPLCLVCHAFD